MKALNGYLGRSSNDASELLLAKPSTFGASRPYLEVATLAHEAIARATLRAGHMGSDEHIFTYVPNFTSELTTAVAAPLRDRRNRWHACTWAVGCAAFSRTCCPASCIVTSTRSKMPARCTTSSLFQ